MTGFLRFVGVLNAAVWLGSAVFVIIGVPPLFAPEMKKVLGQWGVGLAAQTVIARFFIVQYVCAGMGFAHAIADWIYIGRPLLRWNLAILAGLTVFALIGGLWIQPKLHTLHQEMYYGATQSIREHAGSVFRGWHGASQSANRKVQIYL
jgi:hypothetical protein